jgi:predicted nuclease of restriction endonuclease-like RecB superfamily
MLTGDLIRGRIHRGKLRLSVIDPADGEIQSLADRMIMLFGTVAGTRRDDILASINLAGEGPVNPIVARGLAHLLWQRCELSPPPGPNAAKLRSEVFRAAARARAAGIQPFPRETILTVAGESLRIDATAVERALFSDLPGEEIVLSFEPITSERLLRDYNLALVQGALLRSTKVVLTLGRPRPETVRAILRAARFH